MSGNPKPDGPLGLPGLESGPLESARYRSQAKNRGDLHVSFMLISTCSRTSDRFRLCEHFYRVCPKFWRKGRFSCRSRPTAHYSFAFFNWNVIASSLLLLLHIRTCLTLLTCWDQQIHHIPVNFLGLSGADILRLLHLFSHKKVYDCVSFILQPLQMPADFRWPKPGLCRCFPSSNCINIDPSLGGKSKRIYEHNTKLNTTYGCSKNP